MKVSPITCVSRRSPRKTFWYCSVVNSSMRSERPRSVKDTTTSMSTGTTKKMTVSNIAGPRKIRKLARRRPADRAWPRRSSLSSSRARRHPPASLPTGPQPARRRCWSRGALLYDHVVERGRGLLDDEVSRFLAGQSARLDPLDRAVDDAVQVAELRIVGKELGDLQQLGRPGQRPGLHVARVLFAARA